jgi:hypothetical protein
MARPPLEVADLIRAAGTTFYQSSRKWFTWLHLKILTAIVCCRTSALGGHIDECSRCGHQAISFNSCRNRHCPKCQSNARDRWLEARRRELLPVRYAHVVFTLPGSLAPLALQNKGEIYGLLFRASAETLLTVARDERHLGAEIGFFSVLHTWNQKLLPISGGSLPGPGSSCQCVCSAACFGGSSWLACANCTRPANWGSTANWRVWLRRPHLPPCCVPCSAPTGWSIPNVPSAGRNTRSGIWAATRIAWPSRIIVW